jgi:L-ribulose-5-phosphate 4-epimerase
MRESALISRLLLNFPLHRWTMTFHEIKDEVHRANQLIAHAGLAKLTWGNVSGFHRESGRVIIKPSGVPYSELRDDDLVVLDLDGKVLEGHLRPSSDTPTHLEIYKAFPQVAGVCHTHSTYATAFSQAGRGLPCFGTTHADHFYGTVPLCRILTPEETAENYERNTGLAIVECLRAENLDPLQMPAILQHYHAPFAWGPSPLKSVENAQALEMCAQIALHGLALNPEMQSLPQHLLDKHFLRKHGPGAYYGQKKH